MIFSQVIVDTNIVVSLLNTNDTLHSSVLKQLRMLESNNVQFFLNTLILSEICTVVLLRSKDVPLAQDARKLLISPGSNYSVTPFSAELEQLTYQIFESQEKPQLSIADCSIMAQADLSGITTVFTLDKQLQAALKSRGLNPYIFPRSKSA
jgi:predicted nucleic acid-binding protein